MSTCIDYILTTPPNPYPRTSCWVREEQVDMLRYLRYVWDFLWWTIEYSESDFFMQFRLPGNLFSSFPSWSIWLRSLGLRPSESLGGAGGLLKATVCSHALEFTLLFIEPCNEVCWWLLSCCYFSCFFIRLLWVDTRCRSCRPCLAFLNSSNFSVKPSYVWVMSFFCKSSSEFIGFFSSSVFRRPVSRVLSRLPWLIWACSPWP